MLRCQQDKTEAYINTGFAPAVESGNLNGATVTLRFGSDQARQYRTSKSTDGEALFFGRAISLIKTMMESETMLFQFTPFNSNPQTTTFDLSGLSDKIVPLREACSW